LKSARRERQLKLITADLQRYAAEKAADWRDAVEKQICPFCGSGPFTVVALHVVKIHEIDCHELRALIDVPDGASICDAFHSAAVSEQLRRCYAAGLIIGYQSRPLTGPDDEWHGTLAGYAYGCHCPACRAARRENQGSLTGPDDERHGTVNGYGNLNCRCPRCRASWAVDFKRRRAQRATKLTSSDPRHGLATTYYNHGCRCASCRDAATQSKRDLRARRSA
jgi:hypothetical protein